MPVRTEFSGLQRISERVAVDGYALSFRVPGHFLSYLDYLPSYHPSPSYLPAVSSPVFSFIASSFRHFTSASTPLHAPSRFSSGESGCLRRAARIVLSRKTTQ